MSTMGSGELYLLDVGHGNCALIKFGATAIIVDAPSKSVVAQALDQLGVTEISALLISHADSDHLSGGIALLMDESRPVRSVYVNPDPRKSRVWKEFRQAVSVARRRGLAIEPSLSTSLSGKVSLGNVSLEVLHPTPELCLATVEGDSHEGMALNANGMSAVIRVDVSGEPVCLLAGDSDIGSLENMMNEGVSLSAPILIFPHHGGGSGGRDNGAFAEKITSQVRPQLVYFSLGRGVHGTPRPEVVAGVRAAGRQGAEAYIACSQLSARCSQRVPERSGRWIDPNSDGVRKNHCCAGTLGVSLDGGCVAGLVDRLRKDHGSFVSSLVEKPMCMS